MKRSIFITTLIAVSLTMSYGVQAQKTTFAILKTFPVTGDGKWDYLAVSPSSDNLYVSHGTQVNVVNKNDGKAVAVIPNTTGVHGIAFAPKLNKGFISNGKLNTVSVFDMNSNIVSGQINTGENPDAIMYDAYSKMIIVCNGRSKDLTIIDATTEKVVKTIPLGGKPETAVSDDAGKIFINIEDKSEIAELNIKDYTITNRWKIGKGKEPSGLAIDVKTKRLFAGCDNKLLVVLDAKDGKVVKELPIGDGCDGVVFDPAFGLIYSANGEGTITMIKEKTANDYTVVENVPTKKGARTIAIDEKTHLLYLPTADLKQIGNEKRPSSVAGTFEVLVVGKK